MLDSYRKSFEELASSKLLDWKKANKNDLINSYIEYEHKDPELAQAYLGAIIYRYWNSIGKDYITCRKSGVIKDDCYEWLIESILYVLKHRVWLDPSHALFGDPNGPDKAMNRRISWSKKMFYQNSNYACRKLNYGTLNIEALEQSESTPAPFLMSREDGYAYVDSSIPEMVISSFNAGNFLMSFMIDAICNYDVFRVLRKGKKGEVILSKHKLTKHLNTLDDEYVKSFSKRFNIPLLRVTDALTNHISTLSSNKMRKDISDNFKILREELSSYQC